jgi:hypothetical protein
MELSTRMMPGGCAACCVPLHWHCLPSREPARTGSPTNWPCPLTGLYICSWLPNYLLVLDLSEQRLLVPKSAHLSAVERAQVREEGGGVRR